MSNMRRGRRKKRSDIKEVLMLWILDRASPIGRYRLKEMLGLTESEGVVREMLVELRGGTYISVSRRGCSLTEKGKSLLVNRLRELDILNVKRFDGPFLTLDPICLGAHFRNKADIIPSAMTVRDLAVRGGASGATILLYENAVLRIPSVSPNFITDYSAVQDTLSTLFQLRDNDVVVIVSAENEWRGVEALITIAQHLAAL